jgi:hypothetical protein
MSEPERYRVRIFPQTLNDSEVVLAKDYDTLRATVEQQAARIKELEERLASPKVAKYASKSECRRLAFQDPMGMAENVFQQQDRITELEAKLRLEGNRADLLEKQVIEREAKLAKYKSLLHSQCELEEQLSQAEQERDQLRERVGRLETAMKHIAAEPWQPATEGIFEDDARYNYPDRERSIRELAQQALKEA